MQKLRNTTILFLHLLNRLILEFHARERVTLGWILIAAGDCALAVMTPKYSNSQSRHLSICSSYEIQICIIYLPLIPISLGSVEYDPYQLRFVKKVASWIVVLFYSFAFRRILLWFMHREKNSEQSIQGPSEKEPLLMSLEHRWSPRKSLLSRRLNVIFE